jgi:hypothetical protein
VLVDEYGAGRLPRKHSTFYAAAMRSLGLDARDAHAYSDLVPWQAAAGANMAFLTTGRRRHYLRYAGALAAFETGGPTGGCFFV